MDKVFWREIETVGAAQGQTAYADFIFTPTSPWKQGFLWALTSRIKPWKDLSLQTAPVIDGNRKPALKYQHRKPLCCSPSHLQHRRASHKSANRSNTDPAFLARVCTAMEHEGQAHTSLLSPPETLIAVSLIKPLLLWRIWSCNKCWGLDVEMLVYSWAYTFQNYRK